MVASLVDRQNKLPRTLPLVRYNPERKRIPWKDWNPALVRTPADLPPYLILGPLNPSTFEQSALGWSARWQGAEADTHFDLTFKSDVRRWEISQTWCGIDGGLGLIPAGIRLDKAIMQAMYLQFPRSWDEECKSRLESEYQLKVVPQPEHSYSFCGIPDGAFRSIVFPIAVRNLRVIQEWIDEVTTETPPPYPISVKAKFALQVLNHVEGKAPAWTALQVAALEQSVQETGLLPSGLPVREVATDGSAAWTLRRGVYLLFIEVPFAGLTDFLHRMSSANGPIRKTSDPALPFSLRPVVIPAAFETQVESLAIWDEDRTTRSYLSFKPRAGVLDLSADNDAAATQRATPETLEWIEAVSNDVVMATLGVHQSNH